MWLTASPGALGAPTMSDAPMLPQPDIARGPLVGYLPQAVMGSDPVFDPYYTDPLYIAARPPRLRY